MALLLDQRQPDFADRFAMLVEGRREETVDVRDAVAAIIAAVRDEGDAAVLRYTERFDRLRLTATGLRFSPEQIAAARAMILGQQPHQIVFGTLADGNGGFNRDPVSGRSWTWHLVLGSVTFVDVTAEIYDGAPSGVERDKAEYLRLGRFGPWASRVERELP